MNLEIRFRLKREYGCDRYYPDNSAAEVLCQIAKRKCLTVVELNRLENAGFPLRMIAQAEELLK